jgi:hypothetical protein
MQARKRAMRPTQTRACNVTWLGYYETMIEQALDIIGSKATAATLLNGDDLSSGLMQMDPGMSLLQELARRVLRDEDSSSAREAIAARLEEAGAALKASLEVGARDLVGVTVADIARPDPSLHPTAPARLTPLTPFPPPLPALDLLPALVAAQPARLVPMLDGLASGNGASAGPTVFLPLLDDGSTPTPGRDEGDEMSWSEVIVRNRRNGKRAGASQAAAPQAVQFSFVTD